MSLGIGQIWFDGGYSIAQQTTYIELTTELQPDACMRCDNRRVLDCELWLVF